MNTDTQTALNIDDDFLRICEQLAEESAADIRAQLPDLAALDLTHHLTAIGMCATVLTQSHVQDLAGGRYELIVRQGPMSDVSLVVQNPVGGNSSGINLRAVWRDVFYGALGQTALRPETAALLRAHAGSPLYDEHGGQVTGFYATLRSTLTAAPYTDVLLRLAHFPVLMLDLEARGTTGSRRATEREAQRRLTQMYGPQEGAAVPLGPVPTLDA